MRRAGIFTMCVAVAAALSFHALADSKKQKHKVDRKAWDPYACCHDMSAIEGKPALITETYLVPDFYYTDTAYTGDTALVYECYDSCDSLLDMDTVMRFEQVRYVSLLKQYTDHEHTYRDNDGSRKPLPVSVIAVRYDRLPGTNKWMTIGYPGNRYGELREYPNEIVSVDSFMEMSASGREMILSVYRHYKTTASKW